MVRTCTRDECEGQFTPKEIYKYRSATANIYKYKCVADVIKSSKGTLTNFNVPHGHLGH